MFADRMEVSILHCGELGQQVGLERITSTPALAAAGGISGLGLLSRVDRVLNNQENDKSRTRLVKFFKPQN